MRPIQHERQIIRDGYILTLKITSIVRSPIRENGPLKLEGNAAMIQNMGPTAAILNEGWTVMPGGGVMSFGSQTDVNLLELYFDVAFDESFRNDNAPYTSNRLEVIELYVRVCDCKPCKTYV